MAGVQHTASRTEKLSLTFFDPRKQNQKLAFRLVYPNANLSLLRSQRKSKRRSRKNLRVDIVDIHVFGGIGDDPATETLNYGVRSETR
jgi:hypothetical protein